MARKNNDFREMREKKVYRLPSPKAQRPLHASLTQRQMDVHDLHYEVDSSVFSI